MNALKPSRSVVPLCNTEMSYWKILSSRPPGILLGYARRFGDYTY
jgi:hypothetical protein